jgi:hypothetical protein
MDPLEVKKEKKFLGFSCPVCDCKKYEERGQSNGIFGPGGATWVTHYVCSGCSIHFGDPKTFTLARHREKKKKSRRKKYQIISGSNIPLIVEGALKIDVIRQAREMAETDPGVRLLEMNAQKGGMEIRLKKQKSKVKI